ncbi:hypothetical protein [Candidatus Enterovibrio altilux]|uniref:hypothetical protein n=1 Tax=Candidatus Enterovibrio altilux TaxID=1927128 RepID=UPI001CC2370C
MCLFCPFTKGLYKNHSDIDRYVSAIIKEIEIKSHLIKLNKIPIESIFFGGGTPSLLLPEQIKRVSKIIKKHFDLSKIKEFSI